VSKRRRHIHTPPAKSFKTKNPAECLRLLADPDAILNSAFAASILEHGAKVLRRANPNLTDEQVEVLVLEWAQGFDEWAGKGTHAIDCDMDVDCSCERSLDA